MRARVGTLLLLVLRLPVPARHLSSEAQEALERQLRRRARQLKNLNQR